MPTRHSSRALAQRRLQADTFLELARLVTVEHQRLAALIEAEGLSDITSAQSRALMVLFQARRPLTARELADELGITQVTVSRFVKAMQGSGWIERRPDPSDGRAFLLEPSARARDAFPQLVRVSNTLLDEVFAGFSNAELEALGASVQKIRGNLSEP